MQAQAKIALKLLKDTIQVFLQRFTRIFNNKPPNSQLYYDCRMNYEADPAKRLRLATWSICYNLH